MARSKKRLWGFDDGEREILVAATTAIPGLRGVVERAGQRAELQGLWVVEASVDELVDHCRQTIFHALRHLKYVGVFRGLGRGALDLSFSTAINLMALWREKLGDEPIDLVHDQSSNMAKQKQLWDLLVSPNTPPARVGHDSRKKRFPLGVSGTIFVDGRTNSGLQIADIIAGATATLAASQVRQPIAITSQPCSPGTEGDRKSVV